MRDHSFSQISVTRDGRFVWSLNESHFYDEFVQNKKIKRKSVETIIQPDFSFADIYTPAELLPTTIAPESPDVPVRALKTEKTFTSPGPISSTL